MSATQIKKLKDYDPFASVNLIPMSAEGRTTTRVGLYLEDSETGQEAFVTDHSTEYQLLSNELADQLALDALTRADIGTPQRLSALMANNNVKSINLHKRNPKQEDVVWTGKQFFTRYVIEDISFKIDNGTSDNVILGIQAKNSYDGTVAFGIEFFALNMLCFNQFYWGSTLGSFVFKHNKGQFSEDQLSDAISMVQLGAEKFLALLSLVEHAQALKFNLLDLITFQERLLNRKPQWSQGLTGKVIASLPFEENMNFWQAINAFTEVTTHEVGGTRGASLSGIVCDEAINWINEFKLSTSEENIKSIA